MSVLALLGLVLLLGGAAVDNDEAAQGGGLLIGLLAGVRAMQRLVGGSGPSTGATAAAPASKPAPDAAAWSPATGVRPTPSAAPAPPATSPRDGTGRFAKR